jgi:hypothetical protein
VSVTVLKPSTADRHRTGLLWLACAAVALGLAWRGYNAYHMPSVSRDGAKFVELALNLQTRGAAALREPTFDQHPLYPLSITIAEALLAWAGAAAGPLRWAWAGQAVSLVCGTLTPLLVGWIAWNLARRIGPDSETGGAAPAFSLAVTLASVLPLCVWLGSDAMSEPLFSVWYLGGIALLLTPMAPGRGVLAGLCAGAAYLTRPEGAALAVAGLFATPAENGLRRRLVCAAALGVGFLALAGPYAALRGGWSPKLSKQGVEEFVAPRPAFAEPEKRTQFAALERSPVAWYAALGDAACQTVRGGRGVLLCLALPALIAWRGRIRRAALPLCVAMMIHFALAAWVRYRAGYLDPRHVLPIVLALLIPAAALGLAWSTDRLRPRQVRIAGVLGLLISLGVLSAYSTRLPNAGTQYIRTAAEVLAEQPEFRSGHVLVGGGAQRTLALYSGAALRTWNENVQDDKARYADVADHVLNWKPAAEWLAIETGPGAERTGNADLVDALLKDGAVRQRLEERHREPIPNGAVLRLFRIRPASP